jgi:hypothetical protein
LNANRFRISYPHSVETRHALSLQNPSHPTYSHSYPHSVETRHALSLQNPSQPTYSHSYPHSVETRHALSLQNPSQPTYSHSYPHSVETRHALSLQNPSHPTHPVATNDRNHIISLANAHCSANAHRSHAGRCDWQTCLPCRIKLICSEYDFPFGIFSVVVSARKVSSAFFVFKSPNRFRIR